MQCPSCRNPVRESDNFCSICGASLKSAGAAACRTCKAPLSAEDAFCAKCGTPSRAKPSPPPPPVLSVEGGKRRTGGVGIPLAPLPGGKLARATEGNGTPLGPKRPIGLATAPTSGRPGQPELPVERAEGEWPDVSGALEEIGFYRGEGLDDEADRALEVLRQRHPGHPALAEAAGPSGPSGPSVGASQPRTTPTVVAAGPTETALPALADAAVTPIRRALDPRTPSAPTLLPPAPVRPKRGAAAPGLEVAGTRPANTSPTRDRPRADGAPREADLSASAKLSLGDLDENEIDAALEDFGPSEASLAPIADFEDRSPNVTGHTVIALNPLLNARPQNDESGGAAAKRPRRKTLVPDKPWPVEPAPTASKPMIGTSVYGSSPMGGPPPLQDLEIPLDVEIDEAEDSDEFAAEAEHDIDFEPGDRTVVMLEPPVPAPYGGQKPPQPIEAARVQMIGSRGQVVAQFLVPAGTTFDVGRVEGQPWWDDQHLLPHHAQLIPAPGGGVIVNHLSQGGAVYRQLEGREPLSHGDQVRVGQSTVTYERTREGPGQLHVQLHTRGPVDVRRIPLHGLLFGRDRGDVVFTGDTYVSSEHCRIDIAQGGVFIEDVGSSNGTYLRVRAAEQVPYGTLLLMGQTQFRIVRARDA